MMKNLFFFKDFEGKQKEYKYIFFCYWLLDFKYI